MSISAMTHIAVKRKIPSAAPAEGDFRGPMDETARAARDEAGEPSAVTQALDVLTAYIPTEILTIYVATVAALEGPVNEVTNTSWITFWAFFVATPIVVWLIYAAKVRAKDQPLPLTPPAWPKWEMLAATVAYVAWAIALPDSPFKEIAGYNSGLAGILVMVTSAALGLIAPLMRPKPSQA